MWSPNILVTWIKDHVAIVCCCVFMPYCNLTLKEHQSQLQLMTNISTSFLSCVKNKVWYFMRIVCLICYFWKISKIWNCHLLQIIGGALKVKLSASSSGFLNNPSKNKIPNDPRQEKNLYDWSKISNNVACQKEKSDQCFPCLLFW